MIYDTRRDDSRYTTFSRCIILEYRAPMSYVSGVDGVHTLIECVNITTWEIFFILMQIIITHTISNMASPISLPAMVCKSHAPQTQSNTSVAYRSFRSPSHHSFTLSSVAS